MVLNVCVCVVFWLLIYRVVITRDINLRQYLTLCLLYMKKWLQHVQRMDTNRIPILRCVIPVVCRINHYKVHAYIVKHNYILGGMLFTIRKAQLHVSATNVGHLQVVQ
jgi:hypothetical protein